MRRITPLEPKKGDIRIRTAFLFLPRKIGREWRWLERATWKEYCETIATGILWTPLVWLDAGNTSDKDSLLRPAGNEPEPPTAAEKHTEEIRRAHEEAVERLMNMRAEDWPSLLYPKCPKCNRREPSANHLMSCGKNLPEYGRQVPPPPPPDPADQFSRTRSSFDDRPPPPPPSHLMPNPGRYYPCTDWQLLVRIISNTIAILAFVITIYNLLH